MRNLRLCALLAAVWCGIAAAGPGQAMDFETPGAWRTAPDLLGEFDEGAFRFVGAASFSELAGGVKLSREHVASGQFAGKWADHPRCPTIHCTDVPKDWTAFRTVSFWAYSEVATHEQITLAVLSDSAETPWRDYLLYTFTVDWTGPKTLSVPLSDFSPLGKPAGWGEVGGVYFFTKIFDRQPNPYTVLHLDAMKLDTRVAPSRLKPTQEPTGKLPVTTQVPRFDPSVLNHAYPETRGGRPVCAPIQYQHYFKTERSIYGYYPRFQPGFVSFSPEGRPAIRCAGCVVESLGPDGQWTYQDLLATVVEPFARERLGFAALQVCDSGQTNDVSIRFDTDGHAYLLCYVADPTKNWRSRTGLLLHSADGMKTWNVHVLPWYMARFEKFLGHNRECFNGPPVLLLSRYFAPTTTYITVPEKRADGTLHIPKPVKVADEAMPFIPHSGEAGQAIQHAGKVYLVYAKLEVLPGKTAKDGAPAYAAVYDIKTRSLSPPVLIGFGGINAKDNHNWPAIAADSRGILHVVCNGHHNPFRYVHTKRPWDISEWTEPVAVAKGTTYAGLLCGPDDTLYSVTRCSHPGYRFRLSLHRKKPGQPWDEPKHLALPYKPYYKVWFHKLVMDPATGRLFLSYHSQTPSLCLFKDEYLAYVYTWPDREKRMLSGRKDGPKLPLGTSRAKPRKYEFYSAPANEMAILVSEDGGDQWHLATTKDFQLP